ncbi:acetyl-CoA carboxylase biotin carboxyl carrier protein subunit [Acuticoccus sp.]|uniref:acetyl-CoA carboxylase biotin carboxyl carrier protein subunit n=1 Tax=Acuticoccus sp. TaxID=1904378 RepID=UPI003B52B296
MTDIITDTAGKVLDILKGPGDAVAAGETILLIESMKMEIPIAADEAGTIAAVTVAKGDIVAEDDVVARLTHG